MIISFFLVKGHKGDDIEKHLQKCLIEWGISKVTTITVDNASSNDGGISYMRKHLNNTKTSVAEGKYLHMRFAAHIVNLIVSDGLKEMDISLKHVRAAVRFIKNGTFRVMKFKKLAELEKVGSKAFLSIDICTRWNSTYLMLKAAIPHDKVFARYDEEDPYYAIDLCSEKGPGVPDESDWDNANKMAEFLGHFYDLIVRVSTTLQVTVNEFFHEIGEVNVLLQEWANSDDALHKSMAKRMNDKYWGNWHKNENNQQEKVNPVKGKAKEKEKENMNLLIFIATVLDPRYKLSNYTKLAIEEMFREEKGQKVWDVVHKCLFKLFEEYRSLFAPEEGRNQISDCQTPQKREGRKMKSRIDKKMKIGVGSGVLISTNKSELEKYLGEENENDHNKFDILAWWKVNSSRFPLSTRLARDVLVIPISTVASESAFSTGGRVLDDFRTSLTPFMVQVLVCTQDWLRRSTAIRIEENAKELIALEKELIEEYASERSSFWKSKSKSQASMSITQPGPCTS